MSSEQVIELSVEETNKLRAELGLAPLRISTSQKNEAKDDDGGGGGIGGGGVSRFAGDGGGRQPEQRQEEMLEMSVDESNELRAKLGLAPPRAGNSSSSDGKSAAAGSSSSAAVHAPAENEAERKAAAERIERARLEREVRGGLRRLAKEHKTLGGDESDAAAAATASSWARQMLRKNEKEEESAASADLGLDGGDKTTEKSYGEKDLEGIAVAHSASELRDGATTVLTLADAPILRTRDDTSKKAVGLTDESDVQLENVDLAESRKRREGLREKRKLELGMGRAGGYAGFDDDEFEELGGTQAPSRLARGSAANAGAAAASGNSKTKRPRGFQIGAMLEQQEEEQESDLFASHAGKAISLEQSMPDSAASDFMTVEEDKALNRNKKKKKKDKFKKKKKKKKDKKKKRRSTEESDDDDDEDADDDDGGKREAPKKSLLEELEETADGGAGRAATRKRRRSDDEEDDDDDAAPDKTDSMNATGQSTKLPEDGGIKRSKYDEIMAKGNQRTMEAFRPPRPVKSSTTEQDEEPDDAFLNAALAKARRLNRLKELSAKQGNASSRPRGADAVVEAVKSSNIATSTTWSSSQTSGLNGGTGTVTFSVDETREFTRALRAKAEQTEREQARRAIKKEEGADQSTKKEISIDTPTASAAVVKEEESEPAEEMDLEEMAKKMKPEDDAEDDDDMAAASGGLDGATGSTVPVGRGLGGVLNMLRQTGDFARKNAGKEALRGRAKDARTYEDYEPLVLRDVVRINDRTATDKDREFARREVKLEYRDKHGRLLTRKEAFRDLSYQFHGYGSGKRKEEKKLQQIAREQAEARLASRQAAEGGTLGALKATQKATGKAFVVHKT